MELLLAALIATLVTYKTGVNGWIDAKHAAKGQVSPGHARSMKRMELLGQVWSGKKSGQKVSRPRAFRSYASTLWADSWADVEAGHTRRRAKRIEARETKPINAKPGAARTWFGEVKVDQWSKWDRAWDKAARKRVDRRHRANPDLSPRHRSDSDPAPQAGQGADQAPASPADSGPASEAGAGADSESGGGQGSEAGAGQDSQTGPDPAQGKDDCWVCRSDATHPEWMHPDWMHPSDCTATRPYGDHRPFGDKYLSPAMALENQMIADGLMDEPIARAQDTDCQNCGRECKYVYDRGWVHADTGEAKCNQWFPTDDSLADRLEGDTEQNGDMDMPQEVNGEVTGLKSAIAFSDLLAEQADSACNSLEQLVGALVAGGTEGQAITDLEAARDQAAAFAASLRSAADTLKAHLAVAEAYEATGNEAGEKHFVTAE